MPTEPSVDQMADAAQLQAASGDAFDQLYAQVQVAGHTKSIASTDTENTSGTDPSVVDDAEAYLPVATMHLEMAQKLVDALGGTPTSVPGGTSRIAADGVDPTAVSLVVVGLLAVIGAFLFLRTRSTRESNRQDPALFRSRRATSSGGSAVSAIGEIRVCRRARCT